MKSTNTTLISAESGSIFLAPITAGGQTFEVVIDTGSSDTWFVLSNFTCLDIDSGEQTPQADCSFGSYYQPSSTMKVLPNSNFNISYYDGEYLNGVMVTENITLAGIKVSQQEIALVEEAAWRGDGVSSGLVGLAYPFLTNAYPGTNPDNDQSGNNLPYNPPFTTMYTENLTSAMFSLALNRPAANTNPTASTGGYLAIGGIPNIKHDATFASTSINVVGVNTQTGQSIYEYYSITVGGYAVSGSHYTQFDVYQTRNTLKRSVLANGTDAIVDSGTSLLYVPTNVMSAVAAAYSPAASYSDDYGVYTVNCNATAPLFGVEVSRKIFYVNAADLILQYAEDVCVTGVQDAGSGFSVLGDVFLRNVLAVFDVGAAQMRFAAREFTST